MSILKGSRTKQKSRINVESDLYFNGVNQQLVVPKTSELDFKNTDTFSIDFFMQEEDGETDAIQLFGLRISSNDNSIVTSIQPNGSLILGLRGVVPELSYSGFRNLYQNKKTHLIFEYEPDGNGNATQRIYINSRKVIERTDTISGDFINLDDLRIGTGDSRNTFNFNGTFSNFVIYKGRPLTQGEVNQRYRSGGTVPETLHGNVIFHLPLSDRTAKIADERIVYNNDYLTEGDLIFTDSTKQYNYAKVKAEDFFDFSDTSIYNEPQSIFEKWRVENGELTFDRNRIEFGDTTAAQYLATYDENTGIDYYIDIEFDITQEFDGDGIRFRGVAYAGFNLTDYYNTIGHYKIKNIPFITSPVTGTRFRILPAVNTNQGAIDNLRVTIYSYIKKSKHAKAVNFTQNELGLIEEGTQDTKYDFYNKNINNPYALTFGKVGSNWLFQDPLTTPISLSNSGFSILIEFDFSDGGNRMLDTYEVGNTYIRIEASDSSDNIFVSAVDSSGNVSTITINANGIRNVQLYWEYINGDPNSWKFRLNGAPVSFNIINSNLIGNEPITWNFVNLYLGKRQNSGINLFQGKIKKVLFINGFLNYNELNTVKTSDSRIIEAIDLRKKSGNVITKLGNTLNKVNYSNNLDNDYINFKNYISFNNSLRFVNNFQQNLVQNTINIDPNADFYTFLLVCKKPKGIKDYSNQSFSDIMAYYVSTIDDRFLIGGKNPQGIQTSIVENGFNKSHLWFFNYNVDDWQTIIVTVDQNAAAAGEGTAEKMYLNSSEIESGGSSQTSKLRFDLYTSCTFGQNVFSPSNTYNGFLSLYGVWNRKLSQNEIHQIHNNRFTDFGKFPKNGLQQLNYFPNVVNNTIPDLSENGNTIDVINNFSNIESNIASNDELRFNSTEYLTQFGVFEDTQIFFEDSPWTD